MCPASLRRELEDVKKDKNDEDKREKTTTDAHALTPFTRFMAPWELALL
jgi:hypothetical protein